MYKSFAAIAAVAVGSLAAGTAQATDICKKPVTEEGEAIADFHAANRSAMRAWEACVSDALGAKYARWTYSADRTVTCKWKGDGRTAVYTCKATATPCARAY